MEKVGLIDGERDKMWERVEETKGRERKTDREKEREREDSIVGEREVKRRREGRKMEWTMEGE